jgi:H+/Cl- antiporter ClcA
MQIYMIPEIFKDDTTIIQNHSLKTHIFCILLRITIGILVILNIISPNLLVVLSLFVLIFFTNKYFKLPKVWKVYLRTIIVYFIVGSSALYYKDKYSSVNGILIIIDSLMGLQSRHIFERIGLLHN